MHYNQLGLTRNHCRSFTTFCLQPLLGPISHEFVPATAATLSEAWHPTSRKSNLSYPGYRLNRGDTELTAVVALRFPWISLLKKLHVFTLRYNRTFVLHNVPLATAASLKRKKSKSTTAREKNRSGSDATAAAKTTKMGCAVNPKSSLRIQERLEQQESSTTVDGRPSSMLSEPQFLKNQDANVGDPTSAEGDMDPNSLSDGNPTQSDRNGTSNCGAKTSPATMVEVRRSDQSLQAVDRRQVPPVQQQIVRQFCSAASILAPLFTFNDSECSDSLVLPNHCSENTAKTVNHAKSVISTWPDKRRFLATLGNETQNNPIDHYKEFIKLFSKSEEMRQSKELVKDLQRKALKLELRQEVCGAVKEALVGCGEVSRMRLFRAATPAAKSLLAVQLKSFEAGACVPEGQSLVEMKDQKGLKAALSVDCRLFGIVWPNTKSGQLLYPAKLSTLTSLLIRRKNKTNLLATTEQTNNKKSKTSLSAFSNSSNGAKASKCNSFKTAAEIIAASVTALRTATRHHQRHFALGLLAQQISVTLRRLDPSEKRKLGKFLKNKKVKINRSRAFRIPVTEDQTKTNNKEIILWPAANQRSAAQHFGAVHTRKMSTKTAARITQHSAFSPPLRSKHTQNNINQKHLQQQPLLSSPSSLSSSSPASVTAWLKPPPAVKKLRRPVRLSPGVARRLESTHKSQVILNFDNFRIAYAALMVLSKSKFLKDFDVTFCPRDFQYKKRQNIVLK